MMTAFTAVFAEIGVNADLWVRVCVMLGGFVVLGSMLGWVGVVLWLAVLVLSLKPEAAS